MADNIIKSLKLKLAGEVIELTIEQAKELKRALDGLFEKEVVKEYTNGWYWHYPYYQAPVAQTTGSPWFNYPPIVTYSDLPVYGTGNQYSGQTITYGTTTSASFNSSDSILSLSVS